MEHFLIYNGRGTLQTQSILNLIENDTLQRRVEITNETIIFFINGKFYWLMTLSHYLQKYIYMHRLMVTPHNAL